MARIAKALTALEVGRLKAPGLHFVGTVPGLALQILESGARTWILRVMIGGRRREMGLGGYPAVTLAGAWDAAREARKKIKGGIDPIEEGRAARSAMAALRASAVTFEQAGIAFIAAKEAEWKSDKHAQQWRNTLEKYAHPLIGKVLVSDIEQAHVMKVVEPIWREKTETAKRLRGRIEGILDWARVRGYRKGENPARWKGHLDKLLPSPGKVKEVEHHPALPYAGIGAFMVELARCTGTSARALEFAILTAARSGEVRGATWGEVDLSAGTWAIPASRMKAGKEHQVALSPTAVELLNRLPRFAGCDLLFPSPKDALLSDMSLTAVLRRMGRGDITVHGFRSTFRDWAGEATAYPREVIEHALAHQLKDRSEAAYARSSLLDKRRALMAAWATYCNTLPATKTDNVVGIGAKVAA